MFGGPSRPDRQVAATTRRRPWRRTRGTSPSSTPASPSRAGCARLKSGPRRVKGRKITHHALAYLKQDEKEAGAMLSADADSGAGLFMEWAVGKQGEMMRPNTGKLMLPGSKIRWDIHYCAAGEDITDDVELGIYFYPKGQEPKFRTMLSLYSAVTGGNTQPRHPAELHQRGPELPRDAQGRPRRELPAAHAPARQGDDDRSHPAQRPAAGPELREQLRASTG